MTIYEHIKNDELNRIRVRCGYKLNKARLIGEEIHGEVIFYADTIPFPVIWDKDGQCIKKDERPWMYHLDLVLNKNEPVLSQKEVFELAEEAGFILWENEPWNPGDIIDWNSRYDNELLKFAELVIKKVKGKL